MPRNEGQTGRGQQPSGDPTRARGQELRGDDTQDLDMEDKPKSGTQVDEKAKTSGQSARSGETKMKDKQGNQPR